MTNPGPWASLQPARDAARAHARLGQDLPARGGDATASAASAAVGPWLLGTNEYGDLVAEHHDGTVRTVATAPESEEDT